MKKKTKKQDLPQKKKEFIDIYYKSVLDKLRRQKRIDQHFEETMMLLTIEEIFAAKLEQIMGSSIAPIVNGRFYLLFAKICKEVYHRTMWMFCNSDIKVRTFLGVAPKFIRDYILSEQFQTTKNYFKTTEYAGNCEKAEEEFLEKIREQQEARVEVDKKRKQTMAKRLAKKQKETKEKDE